MLTLLSFNNWPFSASHLAHDAHEAGPSIHTFSNTGLLPVNEHVSTSKPKGEPISPAFLAWPARADRRRPAALAGRGPNRGSLLGMSPERAPRLETAAARGRCRARPAAPSCRPASRSGEFPKEASGARHANRIYHAEPGAEIRRGNRPSARAASCRVGGWVGAVGGGAGDIAAHSGPRAPVRGKQSEAPRGASRRDSDGSAA